MVAPWLLVGYVSVWVVLNQMCQDIVMRKGIQLTYMMSPARITFLYQSNMVGGTWSCWSLTGGGCHHMVLPLVTQHQAQKCVQQLGCLCG